MSEKVTEKATVTLESLVNAWLATSDNGEQLEKINEQKKLISKKYTAVKRTVSENTVATMVLFFQGLAVEKVTTAQKLVEKIKECGGTISDPTVSRYKAIGGAVVRVSDGKVTNQVKKLAEKTLNLMITDSKTYGVKTVENIDSVDKWLEITAQDVPNAYQKAVEKVCKGIREGHLDASDVFVSLEQAVKDAEQLQETLDELSA